LPLIGDAFDQDTDRQQPQKVKQGGFPSEPFREALNPERLS
jgi:hypothetical protein